MLTVIFRLAVDHVDVLVIELQPYNIQFIPLIYKNRKEERLYVFPY